MPSPQITLDLSPVVREALDLSAGWQEGVSRHTLAYRLIMQGLVKQRNALPERLREELMEEWSDHWDAHAWHRQHPRKKR